MHEKNKALNVKKILRGMSFLLYPVGLVRVWRGQRAIGLKLLYTLIGLPVFLLLFAYGAIVLFACFLPPLDRSVGDRADRTIYNGDGRYFATFLQTGKETGGKYELVQVELEPYGGNDWHYHKTFVEEFTALKGNIRIGNSGKEIMLHEGESTRAQKEHMHFFKNAGPDKAQLLVKITPASGLEKTLRVAYGLINDGLLKNDMTQNPWHMALLLGYSESYLPFMPSWIQEPLITALAKIAQWKGEDKSLYKYFK